VPFSLAFLHSYLEQGRRRDLHLAIGFFTLQAATSGHGAVFLSVAAFSLFLFRVALGEPLGITKRMRDIGVIGVVLLAPVVLMVIPYRNVQAEMGLKRSLDDWHILRPESFLASPTYVQAWLLSRLLPDAHINDTANGYAFPGVLPLLLSAIALLAGGLPGEPRTGERSRAWSLAAVALDTAALAGLVVGTVVALNGPIRFTVGGVVLFSARQAWRGWTMAVVSAALRVAILTRAPAARSPDLRRVRELVFQLRRRWLRDPTVFYALLVALSVWLAIGPPFSLWPFVYWMPGFNFIRAPSRFLVLGVLGLGVLAGVGFDQITARLARIGRYAAAGIVGALVVAECLAPMGAVREVVSVAGADRWLADQPKPFAVAELPLPEPSSVIPFEKRQAEFMLHSTVHWQKTVHGWSGLLPPDHLDLYDSLTRFPDEDSLRRLERFGVDYVVVHIDLFQAGEWAAVERRLEVYQSRLTLVYSDPTGRVYAVRPNSR
jgi:hypothetical protein